MSAIGTKQTFLFAPHMSAIGGKADIIGGCSNTASRVHFSDADVARLAMVGLIQHTADVA